VVVVRCRAFVARTSQRVDEPQQIPVVDAIQLPVENLARRGRALVILGRAAYRPLFVSLIEASARQEQNRARLLRARFSTGSAPSTQFLPYLPHDSTECFVPGKLCFHFPARMKYGCVIPANKERPNLRERELRQLAGEIHCHLPGEQHVSQPACAKQFLFRDVEYRGHPLYDLGRIAACRCRLSRSGQDLRQGFLVERTREIARKLCEVLERSESSPHSLALPGEPVQGIRRESGLVRFGRGSQNRSSAPDSK
jgi:hypothetical protein